MKPDVCAHRKADENTLFTSEMPSIFLKKISLTFFEIALPIVSTLVLSYNVKITTQCRKEIV
jgi:hypothetical protein